jgi:copper(I)-binding protein
MDLKQRPKRGASVKGTLLFEKAGQLDVVYKVESTGARELSAGKKPSPKHEMKPQSGGHNHH